jgi:hypothetical protein
MIKKATKQTPKLNRNPLSIALGAYLGAERQRISPDLKSGKLAQKLGVGESLYRMIESGNARIHPKNFLKFISVFEASSIEHGAFCRLLIAIQFLDSFLDSSNEFASAVTQLKANDERYSELLNSLQPLFEKVLKGVDDLKEVLQTGKVVESIREFLSQPDSASKETNEVQQEKITGIFQEIPTIYYSFIDKMIQDLMTLPLGFRSGDLWKWEKNNRSDFKYLYAVVKDVEAIISENNFKQYKYEYLWSPNFIEAHIIFVGNHNETKLHNEFCKLLKKSLEATHDIHLLHDFDEKVKKLFIHSVELTPDENKEIFTDVDPYDLSDTTKYDLAWVFELQRKVFVGLKAKVPNESWKLQEGISLNWNKTSLLYNKLKEIVIKEK